MILKTISPDWFIRGVVKKIKRVSVQKVYKKRTKSGQVNAAPVSGSFRSIGPLECKALWCLSRAPRATIDCESGACLLEGLPARRSTGSLPACARRPHSRNARSAGPFKKHLDLESERETGPL